MAQRLRSDTAIARRIVRSFIDFLGSVEVAPGADGEGIEVATECLTEVFGLSQQHDENISKTLLVDLFNQKSVGSPGKEVLTPAFEEVTSASDAPPGSSSSLDAYGQFIEGLESAGYLNVPTGSREYAARLSQAKSTFQETLKTFENSKGKDQSELLAEAFKSQGNLSMAAQRYNEAIELYTLAISICSNNAIYFANRAAAHTQAGNHAAAISDCHKAIEINPRYSKAYSRLGLVYYSQGRYADAIQWFRKALELDPSNTALSRNIQSAQQELDQRSRQSHPDQGQHTESRAPSDAGGPFTVDLRNLIPGIVNLSSQFAPASAEANGAPEGQVYGNINVTYEAEVPVDTMFEGRPQQGSNRAQAHEPEFDNSNSNQPRDETGPRVGMPGFSEGLGPQIANLMQMFGGFHQGGAGPEVEQHNSPDFVQAQGNGSAHVHVESTLPQEFTDQLQFALQSVLGIDGQRQQEGQQP